MALATDPARFVRLHFIWSPHQSRTIVLGKFQNVGTGPALNLKYGIVPKSLSVIDIPQFRGGLSEHDSIEAHDGNPLSFTTNGELTRAYAVCEYENRWGDQYRVEACLKHDFDKAFRPVGNDRVYVRIEQPDGKADWSEIK